MNNEKPTLARLILPLLTLLIIYFIVAFAFISEFEVFHNEQAKRPIINGEAAYHVIVAGGDPEGVAAALSAARNGMRVLLVEESGDLGGLMTLGMLNFIDQNHGPNRELLTQGIFLEFFEALGNAFDIDEAKAWFLRKCLNESNLTLMLNTKILAPIMEGNTIIGLELLEEGSLNTQRILSHCVIDATPDGDIAAAAGAPYTVGGEDYGAHGLLQGVTLVFELSGIDWDLVINHIRNDGIASTGVTDNAAWGYNNEIRSYVPVNENIRFRAPNIARQKNGNVIINALIIFGVDAHDPESCTEGFERGQREIPHIIDFMRENFPGFEDAKFVQNASRLYVRETRHFIGEYRLTITDVLENRDHWDRIGHGSYPVDVQASSADTVGVVIGKPAIYSIPFRCLVPLEIEQLLIASRSASYDSLPHGSARVIPVGMVVGEACGAAVAYSVNKKLTFREMSQDSMAISWLQNTLIKQGAYLVEYEPVHVEVMDHWAYEDGLVPVREFGMTSGGYNNDYHLDSPLPHRWALQTNSTKIMRILHERTQSLGDEQIPNITITLDTDEVSVGLVFQTIAHCTSLGAEGFADPKLALSYLLAQNILKEDDLQFYPNHDDIATYGQLYFLLGRLYTRLYEARSGRP
ncbi:MAG: FAD-dependent oxidoreductase [Oscillospiraceae bacterium]|nr:FAD-dependent oxidoreductase [Oscillospiraceae bacterium]